MFKSILVPTDGSYLSDLILDKTISFAQSNSGCKLVILAVAEPMPTMAAEAGMWVDSSEKYYAYSNSTAEGFATKIVDAAEAANIPCEVVIKTSVRPWQEIISVSKEMECDCIVMASHGRKGYDALVLGSNTNKVLTHSTTPVLVFRPIRDVEYSETDGAQWDHMGF